jgi:tetratricopeptide (TPR) repeat protein
MDEIEPDVAHEPMSETELDEHLRAIKSDVSVPTLVLFLAALPNETHPEFYPQLRRVFEVQEVDIVVQCMHEILGRDSFDVDRDPTFVRFAAFYFLCSYHRRKDNVSQFGETIDRYRSEFSHLLLYRYQHSMFRRERGREEDYPAAIDEARDVVETLGPEAYPLVHGLAHNIIQGLERGLIAPEEHDRYANEAIERLNSVISRRPDVSKPFSTRGRARAYLGEYEEAKRDLNTAIQKENANQEGYGERVSRYRHILSRIEMMEVKDEIDAKVEEAKRAIDETRHSAEARVDELQARVLQFLGFFAALLAVILVSTEISSTFPPTEAMRLLLLLFGGMLSSFAGFGLLLPLENTTRRSVVVLGFGLVLVAGSIGWQLA